MENVIIGAALGYKIKDVYIFVESWKKHCNSDLILIVNPKGDKNLIKYLQKQNVIVYDFFCNFSSIPVITSRFFAYESILNNVFYKKVFITDVRDVVFQDDIFLFSNNNLDFFMESTSFNQTQKTNFFWYEYCYGTQEIFNVLLKNVSCAGTILGKYENIKIYLKKMLEQFEGKNLNFFGLDVAAHNYILYNNIINIQKNNNGCGVATLQEVEKQKIKITNDNKVFFDNKLSHVLHQYDRHKNLKIFFEYTYKYEEIACNS